MLNSMTVILEGKGKNSMSWIMKD